MNLNSYLKEICGLILKKEKRVTSHQSRLREPCGWGFIGTPDVAPGGASARHASMALGRFRRELRPWATLPPAPGPDAAGSDAPARAWAGGFR